MLLCYLYLFIHKLLLGYKDSKNLWFMQIIMTFYTSKTHRSRGCSRRLRNARWRGRGGRLRKRSHPNHAKYQEQSADHSTSD